MMIIETAITTIAAWFNKHFIISMVLVGMSSSFITWAGKRDSKICILQALPIALIDGIFAASCGVILQYFVKDLDVEVLLLTSAMFGSLGRTMLLNIAVRVLKLEGKKNDE